MTSKAQHRSYPSQWGSISGIRRRAAAATLAWTVVLVPGMMATPSAQAQTYTVLYTFTGGADGGYPQYGGLIADAAGNFYGTATFGGNFNCPSAPYPGPGCGVVFKLDPAGNETVLYTFTGGTDGSEPWSGLIIDTSGNLFGTTAFGGIKPGIDGLGVVFKVDASGHETVLHTFDYANGGNPSGELIRDKAGNFYAMTITGGDVHGCFGLGCGVIFKLLPSGEAKVLHRFSGVGDGANPTHGLIQDAAGDLYGTSENGGDLAACLNYEPFRGCHNRSGGLRSNLQARPRR